MATDLENESRVYEALETLPDKAVLELKPGEVAQYGVVRVGDEVMVDLMKAAAGIDYAEAIQDVVVREVGCIRTEQDAGDLVFLREYFAAQGQETPAS